MKSKVITGVMFTLLFIGMLTLAFNIQPVKASGPIYIMADGSIDPPSAPIQRDGDTYTLTGNITTDTDGIVIERDNIVVDGAGNTLHGHYSEGVGIRLDGRSNVTIKNLKIEEFKYGISLYESSNNTISGNNMTKYYMAIQLSYSNNNTISGNRIMGESWWYVDFFYTYPVGIAILYSNSNIIHGNKIDYNSPGINFGGSSSYNIIYHNHFPRPVPWHAGRHLPYVSGVNNPTNALDNGYPSGGNCWGVYESTDLFSGPYQNLTGSDGIGDTSYVMYWGHRDRYPLIYPWGSPHSPVATFSVSPPAYPAARRRVTEPMTFNATLSLPGWNGTHVRPIIEYRWDFGDGNITSTPSYIIVHTFLLAGIYDVSLTVLDSEGFNSSCVQTIWVWMPTFVSISTSSPCTFVGFAVDITGTLYDVYGKGLEGRTVVLYYTFLGAGSWFPITSDVTDQFGNYYVTWIPTATGDFIIKVVWSESAWHLGATNSVSLSTINYQNEHVFSVESNSTISALAFNATSRELSFTVSGQNGTNGYARVIIAKSLVTNIADVKVYLDGNQLNYTVTSLDDSWLLHFTYLHSTHKVTVSLGGISTPFIETPLGKVVIYGIPITAIVILIALYVLKKKQTIKDPGVSVSKQDCTANSE